MKKALLIVGIVFGVLVGLIALAAGSNAVLNLVERALHSAPGQLVLVGGLQMHVQSRGTGTTNVVFLSGLGTPNPVDDFAKIARLLEPDAKVTIVEGFGYGWSDLTERPRSVGAIVQEYRDGLRAAGVLPPYVLVAHSISGIYALLWLHQHPEEVAGLVGLDTSVTEQATLSIPTSGAEYNTILRNLGIVRIALTLFPDLNPGASEQGRMVANWTLGNQSILDELKRAPGNLSSVSDLVPPPGLPVTYILAKASLETIPNLIPGLNWRSAHERLVEDNPRGKVVVLDGEHYIHRGNESEVARMIREMVDLTISK